MCTPCGTHSSWFCPVLIDVPCAIHFTAGSRLQDYWQTGSADLADAYFELLFNNTYGGFRYIF